MKVGVAWITGGQDGHPDIFHLIVDIFRYDITSLHSYCGEMFRWEQLCRPSCNALRYEYKCFLFLVSLAKRRLATVICNHICPLVGGCPPPPSFTMALLSACVASRLNNEDEQLEFWAHVVEIFSINLTIECNVYCLKRKYGKLIFNNNRISWISCCRRHLPFFWNFESKY